MNENRANSSTSRGRTAADSVIAAAQNVDTDSNCSDGNVQSSSSSKRRLKAAAGKASAPAATQPLSVGASWTAAAALASTADESACSSSDASSYACTKETSFKSARPPANPPKNRNKGAVKNAPRGDSIPRDGHENARTSGTVSRHVFPAATPRKSKGSWAASRPAASSPGQNIGTESVDCKTVNTETVATTVSFSPASPTCTVTFSAPVTNKYTRTAADANRDTCTASYNDRYARTEAGTNSEPCTAAFAAVVPKPPTSRDIRAIVDATGSPRKSTRTPAVPTPPPSDGSPVPHSVSTSATAEVESSGDAHPSALSLTPPLPEYSCTNIPASSFTDTPPAAKSAASPAAEDTCTTKAAEILSVFEATRASATNEYHRTATKAPDDDDDDDDADDAADLRSLDSGDQDSGAKSTALDRSARTSRAAAASSQGSLTEADDVKTALLNTIVPAPITVLAYACTAVGAPPLLNADPCPLGSTPLAEECIRSQAVPVFATSDRKYTPEDTSERNSALPGDSEATLVPSSDSEPSGPGQNSEEPQQNPGKHDVFVLLSNHQTSGEASDLKEAADPRKATISVLTDGSFPGRASNYESACIAGSLTIEPSSARGSGFGLDSSENHRGTSQSESMEQQTGEEEGDTNDFGVPESSVAGFSSSPPPVDNAGQTLAALDQDLEAQNATFPAPASNTISLPNECSQSPPVLQPPNSTLPSFSPQGGDQGQEQSTESPTVSSLDVEANLWSLGVCAQPEAEDVPSHDVLSDFLAEHETENSPEPFPCASESSDIISQLAKCILGSPHPTQVHDNLQTVSTRPNMLTESTLPTESHDSLLTEATRLIESHDDLPTGSTSRIQSHDNSPTESTHPVRSHDSDSLSTQSTSQGHESLLTEPARPTQSHNILPAFREKEIQAGPRSYHSCVDTSHLNVASYESPPYAVTAAAQLAQKARSNPVLGDLQGITTRDRQDKVFTAPQKVLNATRVPDGHKVLNATRVPDGQKVLNTTRVPNDQKVLNATRVPDNQKVLNTTGVPEDHKVLTTPVSDVAQKALPVQDDQERNTDPTLNDTQVLALLSSEQQLTSAAQPQSSDPPGADREKPSPAVSVKVHVKWETSREAVASPSGRKAQVIHVSEAPKDAQWTGDEVGEETVRIVSGEKGEEEEEEEEVGGRRAAGEEEEGEEGMMMMGGLMDVFQLEKLSRSNRSQINSTFRRLK